MIAWLDTPERARRRQVARLPALLHALARALRAGHTLPAAISGAADDPSIAGDAFRLAAQRVAVGSPVLDEVDRWAAGLRHPDADLVRALINTGATTGSALAASFDRAAATLQERADLAGEIAGLTAQARASALLLTLAPIGFLAVVVCIDPSVVAAAASSGMGRLAVVLGVVLDGAGWVWMRRLTAAVDR